MGKKKDYWDLSPEDQEQNFKEIMMMLSGKNTKSEEVVTEDTTESIVDMDGNVSEKVDVVKPYPKKEKEKLPKSNSFKDIAQGKAKAVKTNIDTPNKDTTKSKKNVSDNILKIRDNVLKIKFIIKDLFNLCTVGGISPITVDLGNYIDYTYWDKESFDPDMVGDFTNRLINNIILTRFPIAVYTASSYAGQFKDVTSYNKNKFLIVTVSEDNKDYVLCYIIDEESTANLLDTIENIYHEYRPDENRDNIVLSILANMYLEVSGNSGSMLNKLSGEYNYSFEDILDSKYNNQQLFAHTFLNDPDTKKEPFDGFFAVKDHIESIRDIVTDMEAGFIDMLDFPEISCKTFPPISVENDFPELDDDLSEALDLDISDEEESAEEVDEETVTVDDLNPEDVEIDDTDEYEEVSADEIEEFEEVDEDEIEELLEDAEEIVESEDDIIIPVFHKSTK